MLSDTVCLKYSATVWLPYEISKKNLLGFVRHSAHLLTDTRNIRTKPSLSLINQTLNLSSDLPLPLCRPLSRLVRSGPGPASCSTHSRASTPRPVLMDAGSNATRVLPKLVPISDGGSSANLISYVLLFADALMQTCGSKPGGAPLPLTTPLPCHHHAITTSLPRHYHVITTSLPRHPDPVRL